MVLKVWKDTVQFLHPKDLFFQNESFVKGTTLYYRMHFWELAPDLQLSVFTCYNRAVWAEMEEYIQDTKCESGAIQMRTTWGCKYCLISNLLPLFSPLATWFMVPHSRVGVEAQCAAIMWSPWHINNSSRCRLSHLITLNQTNVDERWREGRGGWGGVGGLVRRDAREMSWLLMPKYDMFASCICWTICKMEADTRSTASQSVFNVNLCVSRWRHLFHTL